MGNQLHWNQALIMVWGNHNIKLPGVGAEIEAVGRMRSRDGNAFRSALFDSRGEQVDVFSSKDSAFSGMWIDRGNGDPLIEELQAAKLCIHKPNQPNVVIGGNQPESVAQGKMNGGKDNLKGRREESHSKL